MYGGHTDKAVHKKARFGGKKMQRMLNIFLSIHQSALLVHPIKIGFHLPMTIKSNMNNRNLKYTFESDKTRPYYLKKYKICIIIPIECQWLKNSLSARPLIAFLKTLNDSMFAKLSGRSFQS